MRTLEKIMKQVSGDFLSDSSDYLNRYAILSDSTFTHIGSRSKLLVDLLFSMECSLKSLIFTESNEDEKKTYIKIRKCSHSLKRLLKHTQPDSHITTAANLVKNYRLDKISVACRYTLDANNKFRSSAGVLDEVYYDTVANPQWIDLVFQQAKTLNNYASSKWSNKFFSLTTVLLQDINLEEEQEIKL